METIQYSMGLEMSWILVNLSYAENLTENLFFEHPEDITRRMPSAIFEFSKQVIKNGDEAQKEMVLWLLANSTAES